MSILFNIMVTIALMQFGRNAAAPCKFWRYGFLAPVLGKQVNTGSAMIPLDSADEFL